MFRRASQGFALPTVVISSVVLFAVLVAAMGVASSARSALNVQYQSALARDAAESGTIYADFCYGVSGAAPVTGKWPKAGTLDTGDNCYGEAQGTCATASPGPECYVVNSGNTRTKFSVGIATTSGIGYQFKSQGITSTVRSSGADSGQSWSAALSFKGYVSVTGLASGNDTSCAIQLYKLYCWGKNSSGQVGNGTTSSVTTPTLIQGPLAGKYVQDVATGVNHTCAIAGTSPTANSTSLLYCWGANNLYQYGIGNNTTSSTVPMLAANTSGRYPKEVSARDHTCTIQIAKTDAANRVMACWGNNQYGQAGESGGAVALTPIADSPYYAQLLDPKPSMGYGVRLRASPYSQLVSMNKINSVSGNTACGINGSSAFCIGRNNAGQLGDGTTSGTNPRVQYATTGAKEIATNSGKVCIIKADGGYDRTWCWGGNGGVSSDPPDFRLDSGPNFNTSSEHGTPKRILTTGTLLNQNVVDIALSDWNLCQVMQSGKVYCSGYNDVGQLGQGNVSGPARGTATVASQVRSANSAIEVKGELTGKKVIRIEGGNDYFCAVTQDSGVYCWGSNGFGQLGDGTTTTRSKPTLVKLPPPVIF